MAAITNWSTLKTEVASWLNRTDLTADIPGFIQLGENRVYRDMRVRQMETALSASIAAGVLAVPSGYVEMKFAYVNASPVKKLERKDAEWIYLNYPDRASNGTPKFFAREASNFIFGPYPDTTYTVKGVYYMKLAALSDSNTSNWLTTDAQDLILFATLCEAAPWLKDDPRIALWEQKYAQVKAAIQLQDSQEEFSGSPLAATVR